MKIEMQAAKVRLGAVLLAAMLAVAAAGAAGAARSDSDLEFVNDSSWDIYEIYLAPSEDDEWGPDQLGDDVLESGESLTLTDIPCGDYDILLVDEDGDECTLEAVDLCGDSAEWVIDDEELLSCEFGG